MLKYEDVFGVIEGIILDLGIFLERGYLGVVIMISTRFFIRFFVRFLGTFVILL